MKEIDRVDNNVFGSCHNAYNMVMEQTQFAHACSAHAAMQPKQESTMWYSNVFTVIHIQQSVVYWISCHFMCGAMFVGFCMKLSRVSVAKVVT